MATYTVRAGDTLFGIARRFNTTVEQLLALNNISDPDRIQPGQVLVIQAGQQTAAGLAAPMAGLAGTAPIAGVAPVNGQVPVAGATAVTGAAPVAGTMAAATVDPFASALVGGLLYIIAIDQSTYTRGEPVQITFIKLNVSNQVITLRYPTSQRFDIFVLRGNNEVFRYSQGRAFAQVAGTVTLRPGQFQVFRFVWDQRNNAGNLVAIDNFRVCAENVAQGFRGRSVCIPIRVVAGTTPVPPPSPCPQGNLVANPGFEEWVNQNQPRIWRGQNLFRTTIARTGQFAAELGAIHNRSASVIQNIANAPGGVRYRFSFWAREDIQPRNIANYVVVAEILYFDRLGRIVDRAALRFVPRDIPDNQYRQFVQTTPIINRAATNARLQFVFSPGANNDNTVKIDDVSITCIS